MNVGRIGVGGFGGCTKLFLGFEFSAEITFMEAKSFTLILILSSWLEL